MLDSLQPGPYRTITEDDATQIPFYIIPFDEQGRNLAPATTQYMLTDLQTGNYTDVFLFSHGWNNTRDDALATYNAFIEGYMKFRQAQGLTYCRPLRPFLLGIYWPSIALAGVEGGAPQLAATTPGEQTEMQLIIHNLTSSLIPQDSDRLRSLVLQAHNHLTQAEALELARILTPLYNTREDESPYNTTPLTAETILQLWQEACTKLATSAADGNFGFARQTRQTRQTHSPGLEPQTSQPATTQPTAAGLFAYGNLDSLVNALNPLAIIRLATVFQMKDRAGVVGAHGLGPLLVEILQLPALRVHLIGHSFGCKVALSALCYPQLPRAVNSLLLLQPAISYLCFATTVANSGKPGGYRTALQRVEQPVMTTFSSQDIPLTYFFQLAVRRSFDEGEENIAAAPSPYAALGGYAPGGCDADCRVVLMQNPGSPYDLAANAPKICAINASQGIHSHTDISNITTWWALYEQVNQL